jgi:hypothetical protein
MRNLNLVILAALAMQGCDSGGGTSSPVSASQASTASVAAVTPSPTPTISVTPSPSPSLSPSPSPTITTLTYASTDYMQICPALQNWNTATTDIKITYADYYDTYSAAGVSYTLEPSGQTGLEEGTMVFESNPGADQCVVNVSAGQIVSITYNAE